MHEITAAQKIMVVEAVLDVDILHAYLAEAVAHVDLGVPVAVGHLGADTDVGDGYAGIESVAVGSERRSVKKHAPCGGYGHFVDFQRRYAVKGSES